MKIMRKVLFILLAFVLAMPNTMGIILSQDITDNTKVYPKTDDEYYDLTIGEGIQVPVKLKLRYDNGSDQGILSEDGDHQTCSEITTKEQLGKVFDGNTSSGLILRDSDSWDGYVVPGDYIAVEFKEPVNMNRVKFTFNANKLADTYSKGTVQYLCDETGATWKNLKYFNDSQLTSAEYVGDMLYNVKAVRILTGDTGRPRKWVRINEIEVEGTKYVEPDTLNKEPLTSYIVASTKAYVNETNYTAESFAVFKEAYVAAQMLLSDASAKQGTLDNALTTLVNSRVALVLKARDLGTLINASADTDITVQTETEAGSDVATNTLDYNTDTIWHTPWGANDSLPVSITYNLGKVYDLTDIQFLPRQNRANGDIFEFDLYVGETADSLELIGRFAMETQGQDLSEQLTNRTEFKRASFDATGQYIKMTVTRSGSEVQGELSKYASMAEIRFYGTETIEKDDEGYESDVDKTMLGDLIDEADSLIGTSNASGQYSAASFATYINAFNTAVTVYDNDEAIEALVTEVYNILREAMNNLVEVEILAMNIEIAKEELASRTDESEAWKAGYQAMIDEMEALLNKENVTQDEIDSAVERLDTIEVYASLYESIEEAKALDTSNKTDDSVAALNSSIAEAEAILNNKSSSYEELEGKIDSVLEAVDQLVEKPLDKTALLAALEAAREIYESNNADQTYTNTSFENLKAAYEAADAMKDKDSTEIKQVEVEEATKALNDALNTLLVVDQYLTEDEISIKEIGNQHNDTDQALKNIFDGNPNTIWHTSWNGSDRSTHHFTVEVPLNYYDQIELLPRPQTGAAGDVNGVFTEVKVYVKVKESDAWVLVAHQDGLNANGNQIVTLDDTQKAKFIKVEVVNATSDTSEKQYASLAEFKAHTSAGKLENDNFKAVAYFSSNWNISEYSDTSVAYEIGTSGVDANEGPAEYMFDGNIVTRYHSDWSKESQSYYRNPFVIIVKMGAEHTFNYIDWLNRTDNTGCRLSQFDVYTIDSDKEYTDDELKEGAPWVQKFAITAQNQANNRFYLGEQTTKYVKIVCKSHDSKNNLACAELDFYHDETEENGQIRYSGMHTTLDPKQWIKESAYNQAKEVKGYYGIVDGVDHKFYNSEANIVRYITSSVLSVKAQSQVVEDKINVRFLTSIASTNLEELRFKVEVIKPDGSSSAKYSNTNKVFGTVKADGVEISNAAGVFGNDVSTHFAICKLNNIPVSLAEVAEDKQTKIKVTPYWAPEDVAEGDYDNYVEGIAREFTISELYENASGTNAISEVE